MIIYIIIHSIDNPLYTSLNHRLFPSTDVSYSQELPKTYLQVGLTYLLLGLLLIYPKTPDLLYYSVKRLEYFS